MFLPVGLGIEKGDVVVNESLKQSIWTRWMKSRPGIEKEKEIAIGTERGGIATGSVLDAADLGRGNTGGTAIETGVHNLAYII